MGMVALIKSLMFLTIRMVIFINCRLFIVKKLGVDECLGFYAPPVIDNDNTTLADLLENGELAYIMKLILRILGVFWTEGLTTLSG